LIDCFQTGAGGESGHCPQGSPLRSTLPLPTCSINRHSTGQSTFSVTTSLFYLTASA